MAAKPPLSMEEFRRQRASATALQTGGKSGDTTRKNLGDFGKRLENIRPSSAPVKTNSGFDGKLSAKTLEGRCEKAKLLRDKQAEDRKRKNEERKAAVEDRRRQKEQDETVKHKALRNLLDQKTTTKATGRKLPNLPKESPKDLGNLQSTNQTKRRVSSGSISSGDSPIHSPPGLLGSQLTTRRGLTGPTSASTSCLSNVGSGNRQGHLGASKKASSSTSNLAEKTAGKPKAKSVATRTLEKSGIPKSQSTGAIHQIGHYGTTPRSRPKPGTKKPKGKTAPVHHAGTSSEQEAKLALSEHRKKVREEAERQALLDKEKQEELRKQREEEAKILAEENARETARQAELTEQLRQQEEERSKNLQEQKAKEELEKEETEAKRKEEMELLKKQELERRAKEAEKREKEEEERLKREEEERQERRKRVEMIMSRTRRTSGNNNIHQEILIDSTHNHSATVSEILQKVKEKSSRGSPIPEQDDEIWFDAEENNMNGNNVMNTRNNEKHGNGVTSLQALSRERDVIGGKHDPIEVDGGKVTARTEGDGEVSGSICTIPYNGRGKRDDLGDVGLKGDDGEFWRNVEGVMVSSENHVRQALERSGVIGEDEDDEDGDEGQLWKVVEGKRQISEVV